MSRFDTQQVRTVSAEHTGQVTQRVHHIRVTIRSGKMAGSTALAKFM